MTRLLENSVTERRLQRDSTGTGIDPSELQLLAKALGAGGGAATAAEAAVGAVTVVTITGVAITVTAVVGGFIVFYAMAGREAGERARQRVQRAAIAQNLREMGLITEEEANDFIRNGHLFVRNEAEFSMSRRNRWWLRNVTKLAVASSRLGYQVYILETIDGEILYIGKSGGAAGVRPASWSDRINAHLGDQDKVEWIGMTDRITVYSGLTEMEAYALEEALIRNHPEAYNKSKGEFSQLFPGGDLGGNAGSALKRAKFVFETDMVPMPRLGNSPMPKPKPKAKSGSGRR